jgi:hypothetical protein
MAARTKPKQKINFNSLTGEFDIITDNNFSYKSVPANKKLKVYENMQMVVYGGFNVDGILDVDGEIILEV